MEKHTKERRDFLRKSSKVDVVYADYSYINPDSHRAWKLKEPLEFVSWEEYIEYHKKS